MTWQELNEARNKFGLTQEQMAALLGVAISTFKGWGTRDQVPPYIAASVKAHQALSEHAFVELKMQRKI